MKSNTVRIFRIPSLLLAAALQVLPIVRVALPAAETTANVLAIIFRWAAGVAAALGGVQAVSGASTVITSPLSTNIVQGQPFTLRLTTAPNQATYWTASGLPAGLAMVGTNGQTLWRIQGTPTVTGTFNVGLTAFEQQGSSLSTSSTLVLTVSPGVTRPVITSPPASQTVTQGQSASFSVVASGAAPLSYQWRFNSAGLAGQTNSNLVINPATTNNAGNYDVIVGNSGGSVTSAVATLAVSVAGGLAPTITTPPAGQTVTQGQNATFTVVAGGTAPLSYFWFKGTTVVAGPTGSSFTITNAQPSDAGSYSVIASNVLGTATSSSASLTVNPAPQPPFISASPVSQDVLTGAPATFTVAAGGAVPLRYQWYFNRARLGGQTAQSLVVPNAQAASVGRYFVVVANNYGSVTSAVANLTLVSVKGSYNGLFYETAGVSPLSSGSFAATVTDSGVYSGTLLLFGRKYSFSGRFDSSGRATNSIPRSKLATLTVDLELDVSGGDQIRGSVTDGSWSAQLLADRAVFDKTTNPAPQAGTYTLAIPGLTGATASPAGNGFGTLTVDTAGHVKFSGVLADGTKVTQTTTISKSGDWPLFAPLYAGQGSILGWLSVTNRPGDDINGSLSWFRLQQPSARYYPAGFAFSTQAMGSAYVPPAAGSPPVNFNNGQVWLTDGNLTQSVTNQVLLNANNKVTNLGGSKLALSIAPSSGVFAGNVTDPATGKSLAVKGAVLQKQNLGLGFFLGTNQSGGFYIGP